MTRLMAALFAAGSALFAAGSFPPYFNSAGAGVAAVTFFIGSIFFTSAAYLQYRLSINAGESGPRTFVFEHPTMEIGAAGIQLVGTVWFNISTLAAIDPALSITRTDRLVWAPDAFGSTAFLASSVLAVAVVAAAAGRGSGRRIDWWTAVVNLFGSIAFGLSALGAIVLPTTGEEVNVALVNAGTFAGAVAFFVGALLTFSGARRPVVNSMRVS